MLLENDDESYVYMYIHILSGLVTYISEDAVVIRALWLQPCLNSMQIPTHAASLRVQHPHRFI